MGDISSYVCDQCGMTGEIHEGCGFQVTYETILCHTCEKIRDMPVSFNMFTNEPLASEQKELLYTCPECHDVNFTFWSIGDPCPRCGCKTSKGDIAGLWD